MEPLRIQWATQSYRLDSLPISSQRCVNLYAEKEPPDAKTDIAVLGVPGIVKWVTAGHGPVRGFSVMNNILYAVSGPSLFSVSVAGTVTRLGGGVAGVGPVSMANNGAQVQIVNGVSGWIYAPASTFSASAGTVDVAGSDYTVGDQITIGGGTYSSPAVLSVDSVLAAITGLGVQVPGSYTVLPANPVSQASTSGVGTGGIFEITWTSGSPYSAAQAILAFGGSDYAIGNTIVIAGGTFTTQLVLIVESVAAGSIASVSIYDPGQYSAIPTNPVPQLSTTGVGSGGTFNMTFTGPPVGFSQITSPNFYPAATTTFFDEYFINDQIGSNKWSYSAILDGTTYNPLDYNSATVDSSYVLATVNQQENLLIFKQKSIETWYDTGANNDPFSRYDGATIERGCAASLAIVKEDNGVFFLGNDLIFYRLDGVLIHRLSTHAIEQAWGSYANTTDAFMFSYTFSGHKFIAITFPSAQVTWEFDVATSLWHERVSYVAATPFKGPWRGNCAVTFNNKTLIGDANTGQIGYLSDTTYTEFGTPIIGLCDSPPVHKDRKRIFIAKLELNMQVGTSPQIGQGSDPQIMLEISRDQGQTYGTRQIWQSLGKVGAYATRLIWKKLGKSRDWRFRVIVSDPVPRAFIAAYATADLEEV